MTEADWLTCADPDLMLDYLDGKVSDRKLRLFACAVCRRIWHLITVRQCRRAVEVAERFADGQASAAERDAASEAALKARPMWLDGNWPTAWTVAAPPMALPAAEAASQAAQALANVCAKPLHRLGYAATYTGATRDARNAAWVDYEAALQAAELRTTAEHAELLREIFGNPFQSVAAVGWPTSIVALARALYLGSDCAFALHDALLEMGQEALALHFQQAEHPRGCWALDLILGLECPEGVRDMRRESREKEETP
jgi:hypothetical protein